MIDPSRIPVPVLGEQAPPPPEGLVLLPKRVGYMKVPMQDDPSMIQGLLEQVERVDQRQIWVDIYVAVIASGELNADIAIQATDTFFNAYLAKFRGAQPPTEEETDVPAI